MQILNQQGYYSTEEGAKSGTRRGEGRNASEYYIMIVPQQTIISMPGCLQTITVSILSKNRPPPFNLRWVATEQITNKQIMCTATKYR